MRIIDRPEEGELILNRECDVCGTVFVCHMDEAYYSNGWGWQARCPTCGQGAFHEPGHKEREKGKVRKQIAVTIAVAAGILLGMSLLVLL